MNKNEQLILLQKKKKDFRTIKTEQYQKNYPYIYMNIEVLALQQIETIKVLCKHDDCFQNYEYLNQQKNQSFSTKAALTITRMKKKM